MNKRVHPKPLTLKDEKNAIVIHCADGNVTPLLSRANEEVDRVVNEALASDGLRQKLFKARNARAVHLSTIGRDLNRLKKVVEALAVLSVAQERHVSSPDRNEMTMLDADVAYQLLNLPPVPNEALRKILELR